MKKQAKLGGKYSQNTYLIKDLCPGYIEKLSELNNKKKNTPIKNEWKIEVDASSKIADSPMKRCSKSLVPRKIKFKTTGRTPSLTY